MDGVSITNSSSSNTSKSSKAGTNIYNKAPEGAKVSISSTSNNPTNITKVTSPNENITTNNTYSSNGTDDDTNIVGIIFIVIFSIIAFVVLSLFIKNKISKTTTNTKYRDL